MFISKSLLKVKQRFNFSTVVAPVIDFSNFDSRKAVIAKDLWKAASETGFFAIKNHGIPQQNIDKMFKYSENYFSLPVEIKSKNAYEMDINNGWESGTEVLDENFPDLKETYNVGWQHMEGKFPSKQDLPDFEIYSKEFMAQVKALSSQVISCYAIELGFPENYFEQFNDNTKSDATTIMRLIKYPSVNPQEVKQGQFRAGEHTDYGITTLLFQRGEKGLEVCPGKDKDKGIWYPVDPVEGAITVNIGDSLMRWSDDQLKSTFHRVRAPNASDQVGPRFSIAYFNQPNKSAVIQGPNNKYPPITAGDYLMERFTKTYT